MRVRFTPDARKQFLGAIRYIHRENPDAAIKFNKNAKRILKRLERFPHSGRHLPEFPHLPHREVIIQPYRFFYRIVGQIVWITAVWHGAQQPEQPV